MKKKLIALALFTVCTIAFTACSSDDANPVHIETIAVDQLPQQTQQFIASVFPNATISQANKGTKPNYYGSFYKLILNNNIEIDFDQEGNWTEIETTNHTAIPQEFLTQEVPLIQTYIAEHYPAHFAVEIDRDRKGYEVKLNSGLELIFDHNQVFMGIDADLDNDEELIPLKDLPTTAQTLLTTHFPTSEIVLIKKENDEEDSTYKVYLTEGFKIEFDLLGNWTEIESNQGKAIPSALLPAPLIDYIQTHYTTFTLQSVEKKTNHFEVDLTKGKQEVELIFDLEGNFVRVDY
ncbi:MULTISPECIES: PepSY-like domain-containing protein [unclassified Myroides]|uniref:PepSY-like domain-containing protein n=1 Tax=unclassified Myroides TaxID=2642485 RepID=UPI003D2F8BA9